MPHCFEARFRLARPIPPDKFEQEFRAAAFKRPLQFFRAHGMNAHDGWLAVKSCGYSGLREAEVSGALFLDGLLIVAAKQGVGVEFYLRGATNPIYAYSGQIELWDPGLPLPTVLTKNELEDLLGAATNSPASLTANQRVAAELLNDSLFKMSPEASFLLRISAVEALSPQADQPEAFQVIVRQLIGLLPKEVQGSDRFQIKQVLETLAARQTVRGAYMSNLRRLLGDEKAKQFDALYQRRSKFLHEGNARGTFDAPAAAALEIGLELLLADINQSSAS